MSEEIIFLIGAGGHAHSCANLASKMGLKIWGFFDDDEGIVQFPGLNRKGGIVDLFNREDRPSVIIGIGDHNKGRTRTRLHDQFLQEGFPIQGLISPDSNYEDQAYHLKGNQVFFGSFFGPDCVFGDNNIFNNKVVIEHQVKIGSHCHIGSSSVVAGGAMIGDRVLIGANATVLPGIEINTGNIIGAGSVVTKSIFDSGGVYAGNPARKISDWDYQI